MLSLLLCLDILLVFGILLLLKKDAMGVSAKVMGITLMMYAAVLLRHFLHSVGHQPDGANLYWLNILFNFAGLFSTSMAGLYCILITKNRVSRGELVGLFLPPLLVWLPMAALTLWACASGGILYMNSTTPGYGALTMGWAPDMLRFMEKSLYIRFIKVQAVVIALYCWLQLRNYLKRLRNYYSVSGTQGEHEDKGVFLGLSALYLLFIVFGKAPSDFQVTSGWLYGSLYMAASAFSFVTGYCALRTKYTASDFDAALSGVPNAPDAGDDASMDAPAVSPAPVEDLSLEGRLQTAMKVQKVFLRGDLTLDDLAKELQTNRTYLSKLINREHGESFSTFINKQRVAFAQNLLRTEPTATLDWVALKSGFVSYNSFYHTFKEVVGQAPGKWRREL